MNTTPFITLALSLTLGGCASTGASSPTVAAGAACSQVAANDPTLAAFYEPGAIRNARELRRTEFLARAIQPTRTVGAELQVHARPGMTAEYLQRALSCHAAGSAPRHPNDPLHPSQGAVAELTVRSSGTAFTVSVRGDSYDTGKEIWNRAESFAAQSTSSAVEQVAVADSARSGL